MNFSANPSFIFHKSLNIKLEREEVKIKYSIKSSSIYNSHRFL